MRRFEELLARARVAGAQERALALRDIEQEYRSVWVERVLLDRRCAALELELRMERQLAEADGHAPRLWRVHDGVVPRFYSVALGALFLSFDSGRHWEAVDEDDIFRYQAAAMLGLPLVEEPTE